MTIIKYLWPIWIVIVFQFSWNILAMTVHGNFKSKLGDWLYSRNCDYGFCDGAVFLAIMYGLFAMLFIANGIIQWRNS